MGVAFIVYVCLIASFPFEIRLLYTGIWVLDQTAVMGWAVCTHVPKQLYNATT